MMKTALMGLFKIMPLIFGLGFVAPLISECLSAMAWSRDLGLPNLAIGLAIGGIWGAIAIKTGRWV
jgi:hypothetical protein